MAQSKIRKVAQRTIGKDEMQRHLEVKLGFPASDARQVIDELFSLMREELFAGNKLMFYKIGTLNPQKRKAGVVKVVGKDMEAKDRIKIKFVASRSIDEDYREMLKKDKTRSIRSILD